jgi:hypothetical protein
MLVAPRSLKREATEVQRKSTGFEPELLGCADIVFRAPDIREVTVTTEPRVMEAKFDKEHPPELT